MTSGQRRLAAIHEILLRHRDPLRVRDHPGAQDEYDSHVSGIERLLRSGADPTKLAAHLHQLEAMSMGLSRPDEERHRRVARMLLESAA